MTGGLDGGTTIERLNACLWGAGAVPPFGIFLAGIGQTLLSAILLFLLLLAIRNWFRIR